MKFAFFGGPNLRRRQNKKVQASEYTVLQYWYTVISLNTTTTVEMWLLVGYSVFTSSKSDVKIRSLWSGPAVAKQRHLGATTREDLGLQARACTRPSWWISLTLLNSTSLKYDIFQTTRSRFWLAQRSHWLRCDFWHHLCEAMATFKGNIYAMQILKKFSGVIDTAVTCTAESLTPLWPAQRSRDLHSGVIDSAAQIWHRCDFWHHLCEDLATFKGHGISIQKS
jgi:hypothetical protein